MDFVDCECQLLYKQNLETWIKEKDRTKKFSDEDLKFVQIIQQKYKFKYDEEEDYDYREKFYLNGRFGHLFFSESDPVLFSFTELDGTVTLYKRSVEEDKRSQNGSEKEEISGEKKAESSESAISTIDYERIFIDNVIAGSNYGGKILAYSSKGHIFLIDLDTRIGKLAAIWPIDPRILASGNCYQLIPYDPCIQATVNGDFSLVAATGPSDKEEEEDEEEEIQIRIFNANTKECSLKTLKLGGGLLHSDIQMISFNPCHPDLLYVALCIESKSQYLSRKQVTDVERADENENDGDDDDNDNDDDDDDDDGGDDGDEDILLVLYDVSTEQVLTEMFGVSLIPFNFFYNTVESVTYLKQGTMIVAYKAVLSSSNMQIVFLDAFSLELIGSVNVTGTNAVLGSDLLISSCKSQFAIFKCQNPSSSDELKYDVEVYKVPDNEFSLKNFCRKVILDKVDMNHIDNLNLPNVLKNYLKL